MGRRQVSLVLSEDLELEVRAAQGGNEGYAGPKGIIRQAPPQQLGQAQGCWPCSTTVGVRSHTADS